MMAKGSGHYNQVVGIDLGGGKGKHTAVAVGVITSAGLDIQSYGTRSPSGRPWYDAELGAFLLEQAGRTLVAVDAPLGLPACIRCSLRVCPGVATCPDPAVIWMREVGAALEVAHRVRPRAPKPAVTPYTQRVCEILLRSENGTLARETLGQGMGPLTARATHLAKVLAGAYRRDVELLEVYPKATILRRAGAAEARRYRREVDVWSTRAGILEGWSADLQFKTWREESLRCDHSFDAVVCAYTGYRWLMEGWTRDPAFDVIAALEGWIWFPPPARPGAPPGGVDGPRVA
jgi:predicted nuclease with RNAse H fold